ncbi:quinone oxidoreductase [Mycena rebaudengoi]|nr:quinone oxidoreductase [Mycena rebaudengoi]
MRAVLVENGAREAVHRTPMPRASEVLVKIKAIMQWKGVYPPPAGISNIMGVEFSGHIAAVESDVSVWKVDDKVMGLAGGGAYAEYIVVPQPHVVQKPSHLSWVKVASIPECFLTPFQALIVCGEIKPDDVLSGVGLAAIQLVRFTAAKYDIATASTKEKLDRLLSLPNGATNTANYMTEDFLKSLKKPLRARALSDLLHFYSSLNHFEKSLASLAVHSRMTMLALLSGTTGSSLNLTPILYKCLRIQGSILRSRTPLYQSDLIARFNSQILKHITGENGVKPIKTYIHKIYSWTDIQDAHRKMEANGNNGKIIAEVY